MCDGFFVYEAADLGVCELLNLSEFKLNYKYTIEIYNTIHTYILIPLKKMVWL